jgi:hypothetical protein
VAAGSPLGTNRNKRDFPSGCRLPVVGTSGGSRSGCRLSLVPTGTNWVFRAAQPLGKCLVTALQNSDRAPHRNCMGVGSHEEFHSAQTNHKMLGCAKCLAVQLVLDNCNPHTNCMVH